MQHPATAFLIMAMLTACSSTLENTPGMRVTCIDGAATGRPGDGFDVDVVDIDFTGELDVTMCQVLMRRMPQGTCVRYRDEHITMAKGGDDCPWPDDNDEGVDE